MLVDTHCHTNFKIFKSKVAEVIERARQAGVDRLIVVGSDLKNSRLAVRQAKEHPEIKVAVGVHPHHVWKYLTKAKSQADVTGESLEDLKLSVIDSVRERLAQLIQENRQHVVAVGEVGFDRHFYDQTQYETLQITQEYMDWQRAFFIMQAELARDHNLALIIHNREAVDDLLGTLADRPDLILPQKTVFHCCEPETRLLDFAIKHRFYIGVDGDVTYDQKKPGFIQKVPLEMLVLETDSPYLLPEPERSQKQGLRFRDRASEPKHVRLVAKYVADLKQVKLKDLVQTTTANAFKLFSLD